MARKASTRGSKSGSFRGENEQASTAQRKAVGHGARGSRSAEELTRDELAGITRSDAEAGYPEHDIEGRYNRETEALRRLSASYPALVVVPNPRNEIGGGAEHLVEISSDPFRVLKHTRDGEQNPSLAADFGYIADSIYDLEGTGAYKGTLILRPATPSEYLARLDGQNELFGDDLRVEGISLVNGRIGIAVSQRMIKGTEPLVSEIESWMKLRGFKKVDASKLSNDHMVGKTWYDAGSRTLVTDLKPNNLKKTPQGGLLAIDVIVQRLLEGSDIHDILTQAN